MVKLLDPTKNPTPVLCCDHCTQPINDAGDGVAMWFVRKDPNMPVVVHLVHKEICANELAYQKKQSYKFDSREIKQELGEYLVQLLMNTNVINTHTLPAFTSGYITHLLEPAI